MFFYTNYSAYSGILHHCFSYCRKAVVEKHMITIKEGCTSIPLNFAFIIQHFITRISTL